MEPTRRRFGIALGVVAVSGCLDRGPGRTETAIFVTNETDEARRVTLRVFETDDGEADESEESEADASPGEQLLVRRSELSPSGGFQVDGEELPPTRLHVRVAAGGGLQRDYTWERIDELSTLDVRIEASDVRFTEID